MLSYDTERLMGCADGVRGQDEGMVQAKLDCAM